MTPNKALTDARSNSTPVLKELHLIHSLNLDYVKVCVSQNINVWKVALRGPDQSPYQNKWYFLSITFPPNYPYTVPLIYFVLPPYHMNVADDGTICLDELGEKYDTRYYLIDLLDKIRNLLGHPIKAYPAGFDKWDLQENIYNSNAQNANPRISKNSAAEWMVEWAPLDEPNPNIILTSSTYIPLELRCPLSKVRIREPVLASTGLVYDKTALEQQLNFNPQTVCPVSKKTFKQSDIGLPRHEPTWEKLKALGDDNDLEIFS